MHAVDCNCMYVDMYIIYNIYICIYTCCVYIVDPQIKASGPPGHLLQICTSPATFAPAAHQLLVFTHSHMAITCHSPRKKSCPAPAPVCT